MQILAVGTLRTLSCLSASLLPSVKWGESQELVRVVVVRIKLVSKLKGLAW